MVKYVLILTEKSETYFSGESTAEEFIVLPDYLGDYVFAEFNVFLCERTPL